LLWGWKENGGGGSDPQEELFLLLDEGLGLPRRWKATLLILIPKDPKEVGEYRLISLCTTLYKIVTKILANPLKNVLHYLISDEQGALVPGRQISENIMLAQEIVHSLKQAPASQALMLVKADMESILLVTTIPLARMSWSFLEAVLTHYGLPRQWIQWAMACITGPSFSVMVNGTLAGSFESKTGLRQGCPLSPYLFILGADVLSRLLHRAAEARLLQGLPMPTGKPPLTHLLFADLTAHCLRMQLKVTARHCVNACWSTASNRANG
jgi:hypothetical protein